MTKFRMAGLTALTLAAATVVTPALASAAPASGDLVPVTFDATSDVDIFGTKSIRLDCSDYNNGAYPFLAFDNRDFLFSPVTYFTGDGTHIGNYTGDSKPFPTTVLGRIGYYNGVLTAVHPDHKTVTFFCAKTKQAANQRE